MVTYSQAILHGLESFGIPIEKISASGVIPSTVLTAISNGKREFTENQIFKIEEFSGFTGGQLAAKFSEPKGGPLTELMNGWGRVNQMLLSHSRERKPKRTARRKPAARAHVG